MEIAIPLAKILNDNVAVYAAISLSKKSDKASHLSNEQLYSNYKNYVDVDHIRSKIGKDGKIISTETIPTEQSYWGDAYDLCRKMTEQINKLKNCPEKEELLNLTVKLKELSKNKMIPQHDLTSIVNRLF